MAPNTTAVNVKIQCFKCRTPPNRTPPNRTPLAHQPLVNTQPHPIVGWTHSSIHGVREVTHFSGKEMKCTCMVSVVKQHMSEVKFFMYFSIQYSQAKPNLHAFQICSRRTNAFGIHVPTCYKFCIWGLRLGWG